jgi:Methyltransferase domain
MTIEKQVLCPLCESSTSFYGSFREKDYYHCSTCYGILMDPQFYLTEDEEVARYKTHNNDVNDRGYQKFVSPIVNAVKEKYNQHHHIGLDFGAGTGPVITKLLEDDGYTVKLYDPFFWNNPKTLEDKYDFIVSCEVIEHFYSPKKEFDLLFSLLNDHGTLYLKTDLYDESTNFETWYYKNDPTHVFFYHEKTLDWIKHHYGYQLLNIFNRLIQLEK